MTQTLPAASTMASIIGLPPTVISASSRSGKWTRCVDSGAPSFRARWLPDPFQASDGVFPLCHWGVLITALEEMVLREIIARARSQSAVTGNPISGHLSDDDDHHQGDLSTKVFELGISTLNGWLFRGRTLAELQWQRRKSGWKVHKFPSDYQYLVYIIIQSIRNTDYSLSIAKILANIYYTRFCTNSTLLCPETILVILKKLINTPITSSNTQIPGTYPESLSPIQNNAYHTAFSYVEAWSAEDG